jgi:hypothetical protein
MTREVRSPCDGIRLVGSAGTTLPRRETVPGTWDDLAWTSVMLPKNYRAWIRTMNNASKGRIFYEGEHPK